MTTRRVLELPRRIPVVGGVTGDAGRPQRLAAIVAAYHAGEPAGLLFGWYRATAAGPVEVFTGGGLTGSTGGEDHEHVPMSLPPGASGRVYPPGALLGKLRGVTHWERITALSDGLLTGAPARPDTLRPSLEDCLLRVWRQGFAWLLLAEPQSSATVAAAAAAVAADERTASSRAASPEQAVRASRLQSRHRELREGESTGMWRVHLFAGGDSPAAAAGVAGLLCGSADLDGLPYALAPTGDTGGLDVMLSSGEPMVASSRLVAALAVEPREEMPGVRLTLRPDFDVVPETAGRSGDALTAGVVLDRNGVAGEPFEVPRSSLNRHTFVCGATGAGKSQTVRHLLEAATAGGLPWLVVEPAKAEYRQMADRVGGDRVITVRPGEINAAPAGLNPLEPADGFALQAHLDLVRSLFLAAFDAEEPFPQVLSQALVRSYTEQGWDLTLGEPRFAGHQPRYPTLHDLERAAERVIEEVGYGQEVTDNVRGFLRVRLSSLRLGATGRFFEGGHPIDFGALVTRNVVVEIEDVGDDHDKAFLMGALLIRLTEHLRVATRREPALLRQGLRHLSVFEEAHRLLRRSDNQTKSTAHALELFAALLAEIRAYGEGLVIAEQIPSKLLPDVIKNTAVKIMHRLPAADDREAVGATVNLTDEQSQYLVTLPPGTAAAFADGMDRPVLIRLPDGTAREHGGTTATAAVAAVIGRRSASCGAPCRDEPCTLRQMRTAQHVLDDHPWLVLWAELSVLAHLTGWPVPGLRPDPARVYAAFSERIRGCALSHAVDDAVASRSEVLSRRSGPALLAGHVTEAMHHRTLGRLRCRGEERFLAHPYRFSRLEDTLRHSLSDASSDRHPLSDEWERTYRRPISGVTRVEQAATVRRWLEEDLADPAIRRQVAFGVRRPSALEQAVGDRGVPADWPDRRQAVCDEHLVATTWVATYVDPYR